jgi:hypothetical protein
LWSHCGCAVDTACTKKAEKGRCFDTVAEYPVTAKTKETASLTLNRQQGRRLAKHGDVFPNWIKGSAVWVTFGIDGMVVLKEPLALGTFCRPNKRAGLEFFAALPRPPPPG